MEHLRRAAAGEPAGTLVFFHGYYGIPEDFLPFVDRLDPERRLDALLPRAPYEVNEGRGTWARREDGRPTEEKLAPVAAWLDGLELERTVLAGWSQGAWVSYCLGLGHERPRPAGIVALGGWLPEIVALDLRRPLPPVAIGHGRNDDSVPVAAARAARAALEAAGATVLYRETDIDHHVDDAYAPDLAAFLGGLTVRAGG